MSELVEFYEPGESDEYGGHQVSNHIVTAACVVYPAGAKGDYGDDFDSDTTTLTVLAPAGTAVEVGDEAIIRNEIYTITHASWDWAVGRRPANSLHRPKVQLTVDKHTSVARYE